MRLLHVTPTYIPAHRYGGTISAIHGLCKGLASLGHDVEVYTTPVDGESDSDVPICSPTVIDGISVTYFPCKTLRRLYYSPQMAEALNARITKYHLIHLHSVYLWPTWAGARSARRKAVPYVLSPHGMLVPELIARRSKYLKLAWLKLIERRNLVGAAALHVTSEAEAQGLVELGLDLAPIYQCPLGVDSPLRIKHVGRTEIGAGYECPRPFVLALGRITWKKRLDVLIQSLALVPGAHGIIAGNDEEGLAPELRRLASDISVADRLVVVDRWIDDDEKNALFEASSVFVLPSLSENFGMVVLEAMIRGRPVIVSRYVGAAEIVEWAQAGLVFDGTKQDLATKITKLMEDPVLARQMGEAGRRAAEMHYSWNVVAQQMASCYEALVREARSGRRHGHSHR